jgi:hypothetical protein
MEQERCRNPTRAGCARASIPNRLKKRDLWQGQRPQKAPGWTLLRADSPQERAPKGEDGPKPHTRR